MCVCVYRCVWALFGGGWVCMYDCRGDYDYGGLGCRFVIECLWGIGVYLEKRVCGSYFW